jgi:NAD+ synthase (glutamine-hydrolysing)
MKVVIGQINTTPNDFTGNFKKITDGIDYAAQHEADVVIFPELCIPGYLIQDLIYTHGFVDRNLDYLHMIVKYASHYQNLNVIVGYVDNNYSGHGKPFRNMAAVVKNGRIITTYQKRLLPEYDVFWEQRYFESGKESCVFKINGENCGLIVCEDLWTSNLYKDNPIKDLADAGVQNVFSLNSSPYVKMKPNNRRELIRRAASNYGVNIFYVNQIGGNDELVFDGHSQAEYGERGTRLFVENPDDINDKHYQASYHLVLENKYYHCKAETYPGIVSETLKMILLGMKDYITKSGFKSVVIGSSGGIDSALVATLAKLAFGGDNVHCIMMPSRYSSVGSVNDAKKLHQNLGCHEYLIPIDHDPMTKAFHDAIPNKPSWNKVADENIQARLRMVNIMMFSNGLGAMMLSTMNKTEASCGYGTIYADGCGGYNPIGDLYKMEVFDLCRHINEKFGPHIPTEIIEKKPSAELAPGQFDEDSLLPYPILDRICQAYIEERIDNFDTFKKCRKSDDIDEQNYNRIIRIINIAEYKRRQTAPIVKISPVSFGIGRRFPICRK